MKWIDYLQICCDNKNTQCNKITKHTPNTLWHKDSFIIIFKSRQSMSTGISPQEIRIQAQHHIKEKAKKQIERTEIEVLNKGGCVRVTMSLIYSEIRKEDKENINVSYTPEIYSVFKVIQEDIQDLKGKYTDLKNLMVHHYIKEKEKLRKTMIMCMTN